MKGRRAYLVSVDAFATEHSDRGASGDFIAGETFRRNVSTGMFCDCAKRSTNARVVPTPTEEEKVHKEPSYLV
jgi:hypothetical protein